MARSTAFLLQAQSNIPVQEVWLILIEAIVTILLIPAIVWLIKYFIFDRHLHIKELLKITDKDIDGFKRLYNDRIPHKYRIDAEEIISYIGKHHSETEIKHLLLVCKSFNKVVAFVKFMSSLEPSFVFIAYIAIDKEHKSANEKAMQIMLKKIIKKYTKRNSVYIVSEINKASNNSANAIARLFGRYAKALGKMAFILDFDYWQPKMPNELDSETDEDILALLIVPGIIPEPEYQKFDKKKLMDIVSSIYYKIYLPSCNRLGGCMAYEEYLNSIMSFYRDIPEAINMIPAGRG